MKRIGKLIASVLIAISALSADNMDYENRKPDMVSTISSMNFEYCSIIAYRNQIPDKIAFARKLIEMCRENGYETIKFATDVRGYPSGLYLSVYLTQKDFENGNIYMKIKYVTRECAQNSNIKDNVEKYQLYIDNDLVSNG
ncbi:MAG: hypothetical protein J6B87_05265 [Clostridia bacterium]|nr:hypothetical protein [Clostridia bacterium]